MEPSIQVVPIDIVAMPQRSRACSALVPQRSGGAGAHGGDCPARRLYNARAIAGQLACVDAHCLGIEENGEWWGSLPLRHIATPT